MQTLRAELPKYARQVFTPARYKVLWGGRGAARSWTFARVILLLGAQRKLRILCAREFQKSIADSVHKLFQDQIQIMGVPGWQVAQKEIFHKGTGSSIIFEGLRYNTNRIKSLEGIDICWVEEAESVSADSWEILIPTIRKSDSEIWISFNPDLETDPTYKRFVLDNPPNAIVLKVGWEDNPWFPEVLRDEKDYLYRVDPETADHVWGGYPRKTSEGQILHGKWNVEAFEPQKGVWLGPFYGGDFGFAEDPTACPELWIERIKGSQGNLYVRKESWKLRLEIDHISREWVKAFGSNFPHHTIRADNSRPETISFLKRKGLHRIQAAPKWKGSIEDGIEYLRAFEKIIIHPDCKHYKDEARLYSYKRDRMTNEITTDIVDKHNHLIDATRYALTPMIRLRKNNYSGYRGSSYASAN